MLCCCFFVCVLRRWLFLDLSETVQEWGTVATKCNALVKLFQVYERRKNILRGPLLAFQLWSCTCWCTGASNVTKWTLPLQISTWIEIFKFLNCYHCSESAPSKTDAGRWWKYLITSFLIFDYLFERREGLILPLPKAEEKTVAVGYFQSKNRKNSWRIQKLVMSEIKQPFNFR